MKFARKSHLIKFSFVALTAATITIAAAQYPTPTKIDRSMAQAWPLMPEPNFEKLTYAPNVVVVGFKPGTPMAVRREVFVRNGLTLDPKIRSPYFYRMHISTGSAWRTAADPVEMAIQALQQEPSIRFAEADMQVKPDQNDPRFNEQFGLHNTGQTGGTPDADIDWREAYQQGAATTSVKVGLIDDGVLWTHPDIQANIWINPGEVPSNGIDDDNNGFIDDVNGWDFVSNDNNPTPTGSNDHGTHTAGTVAAVTNNGIGVAGVATNVKLIPIRMYNGQSTWMTQLVQSIDYCWQNGAKVVSVSYNVDGFTQALLDSIIRARNADCVYVNSAGNNGQQNPPRQAIRAATDNALLVAATDHSDNLASFSNYGNRVELAAPGVNVLSLALGNGYQSLSGTSMACPHAAGAVAMVRSAFPALNYRQALDRLIGTADMPASLVGRVTGGRINLAAALDNDSIPPSDPTAFSFDKKSTSAVRISFNGSGDDGTAGQASSYDVRVSLNPITLANFASATQIPVNIDPVNHGVRVSTILPGLQAGTNYHIAIRAKDNVGNLSANLLAGMASTSAPRIIENAEGAPQFIADSPWAITTERPFAGARSWSDSPSGQYANNSNASITSGMLGFTAPTSLRFAINHDLESNLDFLRVEVSTNNGGTWSQLASYTGSSAGWQSKTVDLSAYRMRLIKIRFRLTSDAAVTRDGVYIDDVAFVNVQQAFADNMDGNVNWSSSDGFAKSNTRANSAPFSWTDSPAGNYTNNFTTTMVGTNTLDLSNFATPTLSFRGYLNCEANFDYLRALSSVDNGATFQEQGAWSGTLNAWNSYSVPLPSGLVKLAFRFTTDSSVTGEGVYVDDVIVAGEVWQNP